MARETTANYHVVTFGRAIENAFGSHGVDEEMEIYRKTFEPDRSIAVFDNGRIVGTAGALSFEITLPGLTSIPVMVARGWSEEENRRIDWPTINLRRGRAGTPICSAAS